MKMVPVESSNIESIGYDETIGVLAVQFRNGGRFVYTNVPAQVHADLMAAESKGKFFQSNVRFKYVFAPVSVETKTTNQKE